MSQISIIVEFKLKPGQQEPFEELIRAHAKASLEQEPGCMRFDVLRPFEKDGSPVHDCIWLAELYKDEAAVKEHEATERLAVLGEKVGPMVLSRRLVYGSVIAP